MFEPNKTIEYRVRPVTRFIITRYHNETTPTGGGMVGSECLGEFDSQVRAELIAQALAEREVGATYLTECPGPVPGELPGVAL